VQKNTSEQKKFQRFPRLHLIQQIPWPLLPLETLTNLVCKRSFPAFTSVVVKLTRVKGIKDKIESLAQVGAAQANEQRTAESMCSLRQSALTSQQLTLPSYLGSSNTN
jgi:hypothetical protein